MYHVKTKNEVQVSVPGHELGVMARVVVGFNICMHICIFLGTPFPPALQITLIGCLSEISPSMHVRVYDREFRL